MKKSKISFMLDKKNHLYIGDIADFHKKKNCLDLILKAKGGSVVCSCGKKMKKVKNQDVMYYCSCCKCQKSLLHGTIFHNTKLPLDRWFYALFEMTNNTNGISHLNLAKKIRVHPRTAKRICMKIRDKLVEKVKPPKDQMNGIVEVDETYMASKKLPGKKGWGSSRRKVVGLVCRNSKKVYMEEIDKIDEKSLCGLISKNVSEGSHICSDELRGYQPISKKYDYTHSTVCHSKKEYVRYDEDIKIKTHTNSIEGAWAHFEKLINGTFIDVGHDYIKKYIAEFMLRYNFRGVKNLWGLVFNWCI